MVGHGGSSAGSYLADPTSPIPSHCAVIILFKSVPVHQLSWLALKELKWEEQPFITTFECVLAGWLCHLVTSKHDHHQRKASIEDRGRLHVISRVSLWAWYTPRNKYRWTELRYSNSNIRHGVAIKQVRGRRWKSSIGAWTGASARSRCNIKNKCSAKTTYKTGANRYKATQLLYSLWLSGNFLHPLHRCYVLLLSVVTASHC